MMTNVKKDIKVTKSLSENFEIKSIKLDTRNTVGHINENYLSILQKGKDDENEDKNQINGKEKN